MNQKFSLQEIADWQLKPEQSDVELPTIQRGFVWKPQQVENLWDSILREYPIGSFLFSKTGDKFYLMDGQQRATSIFLGFFNPYSSQNAAKAWALKGELPIVWIDLQPESKPDASKYLIRLTTRSHPWGYQSKYNDNKLSVPDRRAAIDAFRKNDKNVGGYTSFRNTNVFPYDACYPLQLCFFIESETVGEVIEKAKTYLPEYFCTKQRKFENKNDFLNLLQTDDLKNKVQEILGAVKKAKERTINFDVVSDAVLNEEQETENPTLFVRINSAGTSLSGDDLIYSIYKATFPDTKNLVENIGLNFIAPTQVISLASRIAWAAINENAFPVKMNVRQFQQRIKQPEFKDKLKKLIEQKVIENLFEEAINILKCKENDFFDGEIPPVIIKQFINKSQELFLFFVYWLYINDNQVINGEIKLKMVAKLLSFSWFEFGNIKKLWDEEINEKDFWEKPLNNHIWWNGEHGIHFLMPPNLLRNYYQQPQIEKLFLETDRVDYNDRWGLLHTEKNEIVTIVEYYNKVKSQKFDLQTANGYFYPFIRVLQYCKQLILFAQRNYLNSEFSDFNQIENLEDANVPWDWDHIYPSEWVYRKVYCNQSIKDWNGTNGNFRAISLELNRSESNSLSPKTRLNTENIRNIAFVQDNDWQYWQQINDRIWDNKAENHFRAITTRMINIYEKFWIDLKIEDLIKIEI
jgi:hypothetical protein